MPQSRSLTAPVTAVLRRGMPGCFREPEASVGDRRTCRPHAFDGGQRRGRLSALLRRVPDCLSRVRPRSADLCYETVEELRETLAVPIPNEFTERYEEKARALGVYTQTGTFIEASEQYPGVLFNTTCLVGPEGIVLPYRKVNPWIPWEVHVSPHDITWVPRANVSGGANAAWQYRGRHPLRPALSRGPAPTDFQRRGNAGARVRRHGPVGSHVPHGLVNAHQPNPGDREHGVWIICGQRPCRCIVSRSLSAPTIPLRSLTKRTWRERRHV